jgi:hypothetical protein
MAEVIGQGDTGEAGRGGRTAALADGDVVLDAKRQGNNLRPLSLEDLAIGAEDVMETLGAGRAAMVM